MTRLARTGIVAFLLLAAGGPGSTMAKPVVVRSGEHGDFTRIVVDVQSPQNWTLGRRDGGYELRLGDNDLALEISRVFRSISRSRISEVTQAASGSGLILTLACNCHALGFTTSSGSVVVDIKDGPPPGNSPFEIRLANAADINTVLGDDSGSSPDKTEMAHQVSLDESPTDASEARRANSVVDASGASTAGLPHAAPDPHSTLQPNSQLDLFWRRRLSDQKADQPGVSAKVSHAIVEPDSDPATHEPTPPDRAAVVPESDQSSSRPARLTLPLRSDTGAGNGRFDMIPVSKPDLAAVETDLLRQLSRAAAQGLVEIDLRPNDTAHKTGTTSADDDHGSEKLPKASTFPAEPDIGVNAETSIDRDTLQSGSRPAMNGHGRVCLSDAELSLAQWGDDRPVGIQISDLRTRLVGEFDRPDPGAVLNLARLYLFFGFGVEASAVLKAFPEDSETHHVLEEIALILDDRFAPATGTLMGLGDCNTAAALWALLAPADLPPETVVNTSAVTRSFSALPAHLRRRLGPVVAERLIQLNHVSVAYAIRDAIARATPADDSDLRMTEARLELAGEAPERAEHHLKPVAAGNDPQAPEAILLSINSRLDRGESVPPSLAESAGALAFELRHTSVGRDLAQAQILAMASLSDYSGALAELFAWRARGADPLQSDTFLRVMRSITARADDKTFMTTIFTHRDDEALIHADIAISLDIAERLATLGFTDLPDRFLEGEAGRTMRGRRIAARLALAKYRPQDAIVAVAGMRDAESLRLQADALALLGEHVPAAGRYAAAGDAAASGRQSWQGGDLSESLKNGPTPVRQALATLGIAAAQHQTDAPDAIRAGSDAGELPTPGDGANRESSDGAAEEGGPLARAHDLIKDSQLARRAIEDLINHSTAEP